MLRTVSEKSAPLNDLSKNIRNDLIASVSGETLSAIKAVYNEKEAFYLLLLPTTKIAYCFDTKIQLENGAYRVTKWDSIEPTAVLSKRNGDLLIGKNGYIGKYNTYKDHASAYRMYYYTNHADLGNQNQTSLLKRIRVVVIGGSNQVMTIKWGYDFSGNYQSQNIQIPTQGIAEYGVAEYGANATAVAYYSAGVAIQTLNAFAGASGKVVQTGYETNIFGSQLSVQKIEIQAKDGKIS
jgi:hypothetical protein